jgi:V8-like Glu-specific endopeptidase
MHRFAALGTVTAWILCTGCAAVSESDYDEQLSDLRESREQVVAQPIKGGSPASSYAEAVMINMGGGYCSGALIAPRVVLTAGHCTVGKSSFQVVAPYASPQQSASSSVGKNFDYTSTSQNLDPNQHDVGVIILDTPIDIPHYLKIASGPLADGSQVINIGRVDDGQLSQSELFVGQAVTVTNGKAQGFPYSYTASEIIQPGDSGGPVVIPGGAPRTVVAVNSAGDGQTQILARVDLVAQWLLDEVNAASSGSTQPPPQNPPTQPPPQNPPQNPPTQPPPQNPPSGGSCAHDVCSEGAALSNTCDTCVGLLCMLDAYCCNTAWDDICVAEATFACGAQCY